MLRVLVARHSLSCGLELTEEKDVEEEEEKVVKVEREVDVEKSNIRAIKVVCSLSKHEDVNKE